MHKGGLGRGLGALIPNKIMPVGAPAIKQAVVLPGESVRQIEVAKISANPMQPRAYFDHGDLEDLANSIKKHGILQPLIVTAEEAGGWQLIAGERRLRAAKMLGLKTVPCLARTLKDLEKLEWALIENIQRADLNPLEEAAAYYKLTEDFALTQEEVAAKVGKKRATISNALRLLSLPEEIKTALRENKITAGHAKVILSAATPAAMLELFQKILSGGLTVRQTAGEVKRVNVKGHQRIVAGNPEIKAKEDLLRQTLGTKVYISQKGSVGTINIEYYSAEELNGLIEKITG